MNNDINFIFEAYRNSRIPLNEMDIGAEYGQLGAAVKSGAKEREAKGSDTYIFKAVKAALGKSIEDVADIISKPLYDELFPDGKFSASGDKKEQLAKLQNAIQQKLPEIVSLLKTQYPELEKAKGLGSNALAGYTARIFKNFIDPVVTILSDESTGDDVPSEPEVKKAVKKAVKQVATEEPAAAADDVVDKAESVQQYRDAIINKVAAVDETGISEQDLINEIDQLHKQKFDKSVAVKLKGFIDGLVRQNILSKNSRGVISLGEVSGDTDDTDAEDVTLDPDQYLAKHVGVGREARPETGRSFWGGQE